MINNINNTLNKDSVYKPETNNLNKTQSNFSSNLLEQLKKMEQSQNEEIIIFLKKINEQVSKAEIIAIKFIHGKDITKDESEFICKNYPDIKEIIEKILKEEIKLKKEIKLCKTNTLREEIIKDTIKQIQNLSKESIYSKTYIKIKMASIENLQGFIDDLKKEDKEVEAIFKKIIKGNELSLNEKFLVNKRYVKLKPFIEKSIDEINNFKNILKKIDNKQNKQILLSRYIDKIESISIKEQSININKSKDEYFFEEIVDDKELSRLYEKIESLYIEELKNEFNKNIDNMANLYMNVYANMKSLLSNTNNAFIIIVIIICIIVTIL